MRTHKIHNPSRVTNTHKNKKWSTCSKKKKKNLCLELPDIFIWDITVEIYIYHVIQISVFRQIAEHTKCKNVECNVRALGKRCINTRQSVKVCKVGSRGWCVHVHTGMCVRNLRHPIPLSGTFWTPLSHLKPNKAEGEEYRLLDGWGDTHTHTPHVISVVSNFMFTWLCIYGNLPIDQ